MPLPRDCEFGQKTRHLPDLAGTALVRSVLNDGASLVNAMDQDGCPTLSVVHTTWPIECEIASLESEFMSESR